MPTAFFDDRVAIVTGAGVGAGRACALALARRGALVVANHADTGPAGGRGHASRADAVVAEIVEAGGRAIANHDDTATHEGGDAIVDAARAAFGGVDILVNCADPSRDRTSDVHERDDVDSILELPLRAAFHVSQPAYASMKERGHGRIVFVTSGGWLFGRAGHAAAKIGVIRLSGILAIEGATYGITSNVIAPTAATRSTEHVVDPDLVTPLALGLVADDNRLSHEVFSVGGGACSRVFSGVTERVARNHGTERSVLLEEVHG